MAGLDAFSNPFETSAGRNPSVIGSGRGRNGNDSNGTGRADGHSPTSLSELQPSRAGGDPAAILIRKLPISTSKQTLRTMLLFSRECDGCEFVNSSPADQPFATAIARFRSSEGAHQAKELLNGRPMDDGLELKVDIINLTPGGSVNASWLVDGVGSDGNGHRVGSRFQQADRVSPRGNENGRSGADGSSDGVSPTFGSAHLNSQSPVGHGVGRGRVSGLSVIQQDETDDETNRIMEDPGSFLSPENHHHHHVLLQQGRRATAPTLPSGIAERFGGMSLNAAIGGSPNGLVSPPTGSAVTSPRGYGNPSIFRVGEMSGMQHYSRGSVSNATSPTSRFPPGIHNAVGYGSRQPFFPPVNPADQNPPCNTLYVGNLPLDTSEDELKTLFSKQRGYKRLCFRTKQNGPMCFVEFEEIQWATRALSELYGVMLSNSVRGGIRLSFSKNPLGVRGPPQQSPVSPGPAMHGAGGPGFGNGSMSPGFAAMNSPAFSTASGPPPGLPAPQGYQTGRNPGGAVTGAYIGSREGRHGAFGTYY